ncbi:MAG TPA: anhydro-N-acetylmuramic acid kinase, partial [Taishania sp.]|nr:anhydro-N-acetylmuramic acid kinase [Taishania sp.]
MQYKERSSYNLIGLMSGTSLDGLDICYANFQFTENKWSYNVLHTETVTYPEVLLNQLKNAMNLSGLDLFLLDKQVGDFYGKSINQFIEKNQLDKSTIDAIASHGQTIFHQPEKGLTVQIGCGESIAVTTGIKTINDFRKKDVLYGGQGAPLVPIGDLLLFSKNADAFLNIGGFANFSKLQVDGSVLAHDICPANILINYFTRQLGLEYDKDGEIASKGSIDQELLNQLNELDLYYQKQPQSLGWEWIEKEMLPLLLRSTCSIEDKIATVTEHAAIQISNRLN